MSVKKTDLTCDNKLKDAETENQAFSSCDEQNYVDSEENEILCILPRILNEELSENPKEFYETSQMRILTNQIFEVLAGTILDYCILSGEYSCGKTAIVENLVQKVITNQAPKYFSDFIFLEFDAKDFVGYDIDMICHSIICGIADLCKEEGKKYVIFIKHISYLPPEILRVFHKIYPTLVQNFKLAELKFIFTVHNSFWDNIESYVFLSKSVIKDVKLPEYEEFFKIVRPRVNELEEIHGCKISDENLEILLALITSISANQFRVKSILFSVDMVFTRTELAGRNEVIVEDIFKNFEKNFEDWNRMDVAEKTRIAYHEAGHTVLGLFALNEYYKTAAVTSIPSIELSNLGATVEYFKTELFNIDKELLKKFVAFRLAGRESEILAGYNPNNGAKSDLATVSEMLKDTIATTGIFKSISTSYSYDLNHISPEMLYKIEQKADKFSKKAAKYARKVLDENWQLVEMIANKLIVEGIVTGSDVYKIYKKYLKKQKRNKKK